MYGFLVRRLASAVLVLWLVSIAVFEVLGEDYVRTARAKGLSERRILYRHGLRSAPAPVVTQLGIDVGTLLGGALLDPRVRLR